MGFLLVTKNDATLFVDGALIALPFILGEEKLPLSMAITLGAVAAATAPAATLMVVKQYKAKGPVTDILLPVVALDDAVGLVIFAISFGIAKSLIEGRVDVVSIIVNPIPLRSAPPVVNMGLRACSISPMPIPLSLTTISRVCPFKIRHRKVMTPRASG